MQGSPVYISGYAKCREHNTKHAAKAEINEIENKNKVRPDCNHR